jgi:hypothetical protein
MKTQIWMHDHEWRYVAHAIAHIINHGAQGHGSIGNLELNRLRETILVAIKDRSVTETKVRK